uniref:DNA 3'-5' helicase n=1 Tax=Magnetococcus massalia (strain MO-1) TaxID=451514 RepID=A0A1S7LNA3_MAGMO|nr:DNA helicase II [Candidatus Magnetococcus massalia]
MTQHPILENLNPPQHEAVSHTEGPLMVLAGAGSGKTRVLTRRLAWIIHSLRVAPEEILAVTFTNKAAREMRERVQEMLGLEGASASHRFWIGTFHGMSARILRQFGDRLGYGRDFTILDTSDQERMFKRICDEKSFQDKYWTPKRLTHSIGRWKDDGIRPDDLTEEQIYKEWERNAISDIYNSYQLALRQANAMDFGDLLLNCLILWQQEPEIMAHFQNRFRYVLVDEYQDTNAIQYRWIQALAASHRNLCVVGDDDQSIYSWRGARVENILGFKDDFPDTKVIRLEQNYRSTSNILKAASGLIRHNSGRMEKTLWTEAADGDMVNLYTAEDAEDEARFIASEIDSLCPTGDYGSAAILVRTARQTRSLEEGLMRKAIPYQVVGGLRFLDRAEVRDALAYLRIVASDRDDVAFERIINTPKRGLGDTAIKNIRQMAAQEQVSLFEAARLAADNNVMRSGAARKGLRSLIELVDAAREMLAEKDPHKVLNYLIDKSGYKEYLHGLDNGDDKLENLDELHSALGRTESLTLFLEETALATDLQNEETDKSRVVISTLHAAKGLEFPWVFLTGMEEELMPHKLAITEGEAGLEEERRLAYVGITRAKQRLYITIARRRWFFNKPAYPIPSRFLKELPGEVIEDRGFKLRARRGASGSLAGMPGGGPSAAAARRGGKSPRFPCR